VGAMNVIKDAVDAGYQQAVRHMRDAAEGLVLPFARTVSGSLDGQPRSSDRPHGTGDW
jgi:hypothetical protein